MEKLKALKYGIFLVVFLLYTGCEPIDEPGTTKVNFINGLEKSGEKFTAKLACDEVTLESYTGQLSSCKAVTELCNCRLYLDGDYVGTFQGCKDMDDYCDDDTTLILGLDGSDIALFYKCVTKCGDSINKTSDILEPDDILDSFLVEKSQEELELNLNLNDY